MAAIELEMGSDKGGSGNCHLCGSAEMLMHYRMVNKPTVEFRACLSCVEPDEPVGEPEPLRMTPDPAPDEGDDNGTNSNIE